MLNIKNLHATINDVPILKGMNISINAGEVHAIMGPNGSGKSTLSKVIAGHPAYNITEGEIFYDINGKMEKINEMPADVRAKNGIFLSFQYPVEIPGVGNLTFLKESLKEIKKHNNESMPSDEKFRSQIEKILDELKINPAFLERSLNEGFSGGEKKKNEILQMRILNPKIAFLDETDSGLDIDALKIVAQGVNSFRAKDKAIVLVTHYQRLLDYIKPDFIHILYKGQIIKTGGPELALELEKTGYDNILKGA